MSVRFLVDTNVISIFAKRGEPDPSVVAWLTGVDNADIAMSVLTVTEMIAGVEKHRLVNAAEADAMTRQVQRLISTYRSTFLPFDLKAAALLGTMRAVPALRTFITGGTVDKPKNGIDLSIAACAIVNDLTVGTRNTKEFLTIHRHVPLPGLFNPFENEWLVRPKAGPDDTEDSAAPP